MQFPVPQFTEVEDKIIGPLSIKQFGIIFGVGVIIFLAYSVTKSAAAAVFLFLILGIPALGLALVPYNGRPVYTFIGKLITFVMSPKVMVFHKEPYYGPLNATKVQDQPKPQEALQAPQTQEHLKEIEALLAKTSTQERNIAGKIH